MGKKDLRLLRKAALSAMALAVMIAAAIFVFYIFRFFPSLYTDDFVSDGIDAGCAAWAGLMFYGLFRTAKKNRQKERADGPEED